MAKLRIPESVAFLSTLFALGACGRSSFSGSSRRGLTNPTPVDTTAIRDTNPLPAQESKATGAEDLDGNKKDKGTGDENFDAPPPQIFSVGILTQSVQCFFCHMKIEGDVGGILSPNQPNVPRGDSGVGLTIAGKFYSTDAIPSFIAGKSTRGEVANYRNGEFKIFPKDRTGDGVPDFPVLDTAALSAAAKGTLQSAGGVVKVNGRHTGNLILAGDATNPIVIAGEVFVDGDVIIQGVYQGVGTLYARNIFIASDLTAKNSPFPYPVDETGALAQAKQDVLSGKDALYLGALNEITVGDMENNLTFDNGERGTTVNPYGWKSDYEALGKPAPEAVSRGVNWAWAQVEVNRVDAYLYAGRAVTWRAFGSILLNGGFAAPHATFVSWTGMHGKNNGITGMNPRNGIDYGESLVRYDYRLRVSGKGFETLKKQFEAQ